MSEARASWRAFYRELLGAVYERYIILRFNLVRTTHGCDTCAFLRQRHEDLYHSGFKLPLYSPNFPTVESSTLFGAPLSHHQSSSVFGTLRTGALLVSINGNGRSTGMYCIGHDFGAKQTASAEVVGDDVHITVALGVINGAEFFVLVLLKCNDMHTVYVGVCNSDLAFSQASQTALLTLSVT